MRDHFGWEYKGRHKDLKAAYNQLLQYREDLENPPLLIVCAAMRASMDDTAMPAVRHEFTMRAACA